MKSSIENKHSILLSREENEQVFRLFGTKCQSLATSVVQLYVTTPSSEHAHWLKKDSGVMCFIKDNIRRNYFFRMYCLTRNKMIWEQELYNNFDYKSPKDYFHMFEVDDCIAGINFASEEEARLMEAIINEKLALKRQRREERRSRNSLQNHSYPNKTLNKQSTLHSNTTLSNDRLPYNQSNNISFNSGQQLTKNKKKRNITKDDISLPTDFIHISHVGWDPNKGFDINVEDPELKKFFSKAGVSDRQLQDKDTRDFIYDFINKNGGLDAVKSDINDSILKRNNALSKAINQIPPTPPPVPARTPVNRSAPPPPPPNKVKPSSQSRGQPPPRPDPIQPVSVPEPPPICNVPAPPPPPPMNDFNASAPTPAPIPPAMTNFNNSTPDPRSALLESIRAGKALKPVEVERKPSVGDSRGDLLHEIRQGIELKPVQNCQKPPSGPSCAENSLAEALSNALKARAFAIHSDSESDSGNSTDDEDEWEQDD